MSNVTVQHPSHSQVLIMAGGTGGHIFPGIALAEALSSRGVSVSWLGCVNSMEQRITAANQIAFHTIDVNGVRGKGLITKIKAPFMLIKACMQAFKKIKTITPQVVVGFGGFVSAPGGLASKLLGIPLLIHEQNAVAGSSNKLLSRFSKKIFTAFPDVMPNAAWVGNPIRSSLKNIQHPNQRAIASSNTRRVLILGGSRGARFLNQNVASLIKKLSEALPSLRFVVRHQCGAGHSESTKAAYSNAGLTPLRVGSLEEASSEPAPHIEVTEFIEQIDKALGQADFVICRAGASTVTELCAVGVGSLLIPFPYGIDDHQTANARFAVSANAALLYQEREWSQDSVAAALIPLMESQDKLKSMAVNARKLSKTDAASEIADHCLSLITGAGAK